MVLIAALAVGASAMVLCHNHPSGELTPCFNDIALTTRLIKAAELFEIKVLDDLIISRWDFYSMAERGDM